MRLGHRARATDGQWERSPSTWYPHTVFTDEAAGQGHSHALLPPVSRLHRLVSRGHSGDLWAATSEAPDAYLLQPRWPLCHSVCLRGCWRQEAGDYAGVGMGLGDPPPPAMWPTCVRKPQSPPAPSSASWGGWAWCPTPTPALIGARGSSSPPGQGPTAQWTRGRDRMAEVLRPLDLFRLFNIQ